MSTNIFYNERFTASQVATLVDLSAAAYDDSPSVQSWQSITSDLVGYGLKSSDIKGTSYSRLAATFDAAASFWTTRIAEANVALLRNTSTNEIAVAFRGTNGAGDASYWTNMDAYYEIYKDFFAALKNYISAKGITRLSVTGHSLGGAMAEKFAYSFERESGCAVDCVGVASPWASYNGSDMSVVNIGHSNDIVYSIAGWKGDNAISNLYVALDNGGFFSDLANVTAHSVSFYQYTAHRIAASSLLGDMTKNDTVIVDNTGDDGKLSAQVASESKSILPRFTSQKLYVLGGYGSDSYDFSAASAGSALYAAPTIIIEGSSGNDSIRGGPGRCDVAVYSEEFSRYDAGTGSGVTTINHARGSRYDGTDSLTAVEIGRFKDRSVDLALLDGPTYTTSTAISTSSGQAVGKLSVTLPTSMLDGNADISINLSSSGITKKYNFALVIDVSGSMSGTPLEDAKAAYITLINHLESIGAASSSTFAVIPFASSADLYSSLTASQARDAIRGLSASGGTDYEQALIKARDYFNATSAYNVTNITYFMSDGMPNEGNYSTVAPQLQRLSDVRAYGIGSAQLSDLDAVDSNDAQQLKSASELASAFTASQLRKADVAGIDILLNGTVVRQLSSADLTEDTLGLTYHGTVAGLDTSLFAANGFEVRARFTDPTWVTPAVKTEVHAFDATLRARSRGFNFDGDQYDDVLLQSQYGAGSTVGYNTDGQPSAAPRPGAVAIWTMDDTAIKTGSVAKILNDTNWMAVGSSDFDADGKSDVLLRHRDGRVAVWSMNGATIANGGVVKTLSDPNWAIATIGDFDGNGAGDVMLKHTDGRIALWEFSGGQFVRGVVVKTLADAAWKVAASGDFDGNGREDVLFQHASDGRLALWSMDGANIASTKVVATLNDRGWKVEGAGDFNADGIDDILLKHTDGRLKVWELSGSGSVTEKALPTLSDPNWDVAALGDYNGDGRTDIVFQNPDGRIATWLMDDSNRLHAAVTKSFADNQWTVIGDGQYV